MKQSIRRAIGAVAGLVFAGAAIATVAPAPAVATPPDVVVAVIDTGVRATHQEFDYGGASSTTDQFVGWWDFSFDALWHEPATGQTWDTTFADPFDPEGHGTATAAAAVGRNISASKTKSFAPGVKLAVAKVADQTGNLNGNLAAAIKWARETIDADVISMSIGAIVPQPMWSSRPVYEEIRLAREAGILFVVSNGNGWANLGLVPAEPGFATPYGNSPYALAVGATGTDGLLVTTDPEVVAAYRHTAASNACDTCYGSIAGTSFSAPRVAGFTAHLKQTGLANGQTPTADYLETLVKYSARATSTPPSNEGYGVIDEAQLAAAESHAAAGTLPTRPSPDLDALYVDMVNGTLDTAWTVGTCACAPH